MDFATLPPEINSGLMYSGPGTGSMMRGAAAWEMLAARLFTAAADYRAVSAQLKAGDESPALTEAATRYADWLHAVAARSEHAAAQLKAAAGAHQSALTATVPPPAVAGNRRQRMSLVSTNCLGHNSAVIANVDAEYDAMWAQNAAAMHGYAGSAAGCRGNGSLPRSARQSPCEETQLGPPVGAGRHIGRL